MPHLMRRSAQASVGKERKQSSTLLCGRRLDRSLFVLLCSRTVRHLDGDVTRFDKDAILHKVADQSVRTHPPSGHVIGQEVFVPSGQVLGKLRFWNHVHFLGEFFGKHPLHNAPHLVEPSGRIDDKKKIHTDGKRLSLQHVHELRIR